MGEEEDDDPTSRPVLGTQPGPDHAAPPSVLRPQLRRKASSVRPWMVVTESGQSRVEEVGRFPMMRRTGLPARDLRAIDPATGHPAGILARRRAMVVHLEHARAVITATEVWVPDPGDPLVSPFAVELQARFADALAAVAPHGNDDSGLQAQNQTSKGGGEPAEVPGTVTDEEFCAPSEESSGVLDENKHGSKRAMGRGPVLPFEFRALEVCLESVCGRLEFEAVILEKEAYRAMNGLNSKISTHKLERVRQIQCRLLAVAGRAKRVRDEIERILDSETDMVEMHLTEKLTYERKSNLSLRHEPENEDFYSRRDGIEDGMQKSETEVLPRNPSGHIHNIQELEKLLEAYFVQSEGILSKLSITRELVDDAMNYANILLDDRQNQLLHMGVMVSTAALFTGAAIVVANHLGSSLKITLFNNGTDKQFWEAAIGMTVSTIVVYFITIGWYKKNGILV